MILRSTKTKALVFALLAILGVALDQVTKWLVLQFLYPKEPPQMALIPGILELLYTENRGAAFGILQNKHWFFAIITVLVLGAIVYILFRMPGQSKYLPLFYTLSFIFSGAVGNFLDRLRLGYVIDFIYFKPIRFPVFNVADILVTCATIVLIYLFIFVYKDQDLVFIKKQS